MFISTLSKHLPAVIDYMQTPPGDCLLEVVYLVESARYHLHNLNELTTGKAPAPKDFQSGVDFKGEALNSHWRIMAALIELEAFLTSAKRYLDRSWCCIGERLGDETSKIKTLGGAVYNLDKKVKDKKVIERLNNTTYYVTLNDAWSEWGAKLADLRNYVEHQAPLGGQSFGYTQKTDEGDVIKIFIPDDVPSSRSEIPKKSLAFEKQITANNYCQHIIEKMDELTNALLSEAKVLKYIEL